MKNTKIYYPILAILIITIIISGIVSNVDKERKEEVVIYVDPRPGDQIAFIETFKKLEEEYYGADGNEVVKRELASKIKNYLSSVRSFNGWIANVREITGRITVDFDSPELSKPKGESDYSEKTRGKMYVKYDDLNLIKELRRSDYILFSGQITGEESFTNDGSVDEPEISIIANSCQIYNR